MKQVELAQKTKMSTQHICDLKAGRRGMSIKNAKLFEAATGIPARQWLLPDEFGNPWTELEKL